MYDHHSAAVFPDGMDVEEKPMDLWRKDVYYENNTDSSRGGVDRLCGIPCRESAVLIQQAGRVTRKPRPFRQTQEEAAALPAELILHMRRNGGIS